MTNLFALGLMSGSSLDGLDLAYCKFGIDALMMEKPLVEWSIQTFETTAYPEPWKERLESATKLDGRSLWQLHTDLGHYMGQAAKRFIEKHQLEPNLIGSHGHTVFHHPEQGFTTQIGDGAAIAAETGIATVDQLRSMDLAYGGQGAPLAPLADRYCFGQYDFCLNLGGIANLSAQTPRGYIAFDVSYANQILDKLAQVQAKAFDEEGQMARAGKLIPALLRQLDQLPYFSQHYPKSLDNAWVQEEVWPLFRDYPAPVEDRLRTACEHIGWQIAAHLNTIIRRENLRNKTFSLFVTGGGAHNKFLLECIQSACKDRQDIQIVIPDQEIIEGKEAMFIGLAAALRYLGLPNSMPSATGATKPPINGSLYLP